MLNRLTYYTKPTLYATGLQR